MSEIVKNKKLKDIIPILWSSYEHMFAVRETGTTNGINYLMVVATFLPVFCLTLYMAFQSILFLVPILFQIAALLILLKRFFIKGQIHWFKLEDTLLQLDNNALEKYLFAELKAFEDDSWRRSGAFSTIIKRALFLLVFSIFLTSLVSAFVFMKGDIQLYVVTVFLVVVFLLLYFFYKEVPENKFEDDKQRYLNDINIWLKKNEGESGPETDSITK